MKNIQNSDLLIIPVGFGSSSDFSSLKKATSAETEELKMRFAGLALAQKNGKEEFDRFIYKLSGKAKHTLKIGDKIVQFWLLIKSVFKTKNTNVIV